MPPCGDAGVCTDAGAAGAQQRGRQWSGQVLVVRPFTPRLLDSGGAPVVLVDIEPTHLRYNTFARRIGPDPVRVLGAQCAGALLSTAREFAGGELRAQQLQAAMQLAVAEVADQIAPADPLPPRVLSMMAAIRLDPGIASAALATVAECSAARASRLFVDHLGISPRQYALAVKIQRAALFFGSGRPLTQVAQASGFADSAHLAKVWQRCYGAPPSRYFLELASVQGGSIEQAWRRRVRLAHTA
ncbi:AraC family transcriptional regulator [Piscinibacter aquaticus]|uniref:AraC family transcriptional regulator n=1 Tax=Piscinibacter aquaticus TaxID=392597 RepID=A0A5C6U1X5_9BURK|nr:AraC family transcriptional regulator [Piscinibacter aquaticus]